MRRLSISNSLRKFSLRFVIISILDLPKNHLGRLPELWWLLHEALVHQFLNCNLLIENAESIMASNISPDEMAGYDWYIFSNASQGLRWPLTVVITLDVTNWYSGAGLQRFCITKVYLFEPFAGQGSPFWRAPVRWMQLKQNLISQFNFCLLREW